MELNEKYKKLGFTVEVDYNQYSADIFPIYIIRRNNRIIDRDDYVHLYGYGDDRFDTVIPIEEAIEDTIECYLEERPRLKKMLNK